MSNFISLLGTEEVQKAGYRMRDAADTMERAASSIADSVERLRIILDEFAARIEAAGKGE